MNTSQYLWQSVTRKTGKALPVLSFPAIQKMGITVRTLVENSRFQADAMTLVARDTPTLAAVSLMNLSVEAQAFGAAVRWSENEVPTITGRLIANMDAAEALRVPRIGEGRTGVCLEAICLARRQIADKPVLAGMIGPFSLAGRLCGVTEIMYMCFDEPDTVYTVLKKSVDFLTQYALALRAAGADGLVMAEPLAGLLSSAFCGEFSTPYVKCVIDAVQTEDFAVVYHNCGNAAERLTDEIFSVNAAAYHFGNAVSMRKILEKAPATKLCMGNIDPAGQFAGGTPQSVTKAVNELLDECGGYPNFILSSGCDIPPQAKWDNIEAFFRAGEAYVK